MRKLFPVFGEKALKLRSGAVYNMPMEVYFLDLEPLRGRMDEALSRLDPARREKALRLRPEEKRRQSTGAGLLLGRFFPGASVTTDEHGKPYVPGGRCFSLSHSGAAAVIALDDAPVGVDIERIALPRDAAARRVLTAEELAALDTLGGGGFTLLWTRKEAALKCLGVGVRTAPGSFSALGDEAAVDGTAIRLFSVRRGGYIVSAASVSGDAAFTLVELSADELLR